MNCPLTRCPKPFISAIVTTAAALALTGCGGGGGSGFAFPVSQAPAPAQATQAAAPVPPPATQAAAPVPPPATQAAAPVPPPSGSLIGNSAPVSNAGTAQSATAGTVVKLDGSASTDADSDSLSYAWTLISKPTGSASTLVGADSAKPTFTPDVAGIYVASLIVNDGKVSSEPATVTVTTDAIAFDSMPSPFPPNMPSYGFEAYALKSLGDRITLKSGTPRKLEDITVAMSSWACQSGGWNSNDCTSNPNAAFNHPITMNVYDETRTTLLASVTQDFSVPYRPSADPACTGVDAGKWKASNGECKNGFAFKIAFDLRSKNVTLPDTFIYEVVYNTNTQGPAPLGQPGPYDSLNIGVYDSTATAPSVGSDSDPGLVLWNGLVANAENDPTNKYGLMAQVHVAAP
jgi:PKD domain